MNSLGLISRLGIKVTAIAFIALAVALAIFLLIYEVAVPEFLYGESFDKYWTKQETTALEDFQAYVTEKELTVQEAIKDVDWEKAHHTVYPYVEKYDSDSAEWYSPEEYAKHEIQCSDGTVYAFFDPSIGYYYNIGRVVALMISAICFFLIFLPYIYHVVHRITRLSREMEVLAGGDLSYKIVSAGRDELSELGRDIEGMRCSVLEQIAHENKSVLANSQLITSLSHDLRTPLTKLTGYLEILQHKKYKDESEHDLYLSKALEKAGQMQSLSDEMFRNFQVDQINYTKSENQYTEFVSATQIIKMLTDQCYDLRDEGFQVVLPESIGPCLVQIHQKDLQRIFDNLFSNLRKYADKEYPISVSANKLDDCVKVTLKNHVRVRPNTASTGIGLPTVRSLVSKNGGRIEIEQADSEFITFLHLTKLK